MVKWVCCTVHIWYERRMYDVLPSLDSPHKGPVIDTFDVLSNFNLENWCTNNQKLDIAAYELSTYGTSSKYTYQFATGE